MGYDIIVYFKVRSKKLYYPCIEDACNELNLKFISFGNWCTEDLGHKEKISELCEEQRFTEISKLI